MSATHFPHILPCFDRAHAAPPASAGSGPLSAARCPPVGLSSSPPGPRAGHAACERHATQSLASYLCRARHHTTPTRLGLPWPSLLLLPLLAATAVAWLPELRCPRSRLLVSSHGVALRQLRLHADLLFLCHPSVSNVAIGAVKPKLPTVPWPSRRNAMPSSFNRAKHPPLCRSAARRAQLLSAVSPRLHLNVEHRHPFLR
jgi:hypothetical protein